MTHDYVERKNTAANHAHRRFAAYAHQVSDEHKIRLANGHLQNRFANGQ